MKLWKKNEEIFSNLLDNAIQFGIKMNLGKQKITKYYMEELEESFNEIGKSKLSSIKEDALTYFEDKYDRRMYESIEE